MFNRSECYQLLGLVDNASASCTEHTLKQAFRRRVLQTHPDKPGGSAAEFVRVKEAYDCLLSGKAPRPPPPPPPSAPLRRQSQKKRKRKPAPAPASAPSPASAPAPAPTPVPRAPPPRLRATDVFSPLLQGEWAPYIDAKELAKGHIQTTPVCLNVSLTLEQVYAGCVRSIDFVCYVPCPKCPFAQNFNADCKHCEGEQIVPSVARVAVTVPPSSFTGERILLQRKSHNLGSWCERGAVSVSLFELPNATFERRGYDLFHYFLSSMADARKGKSIVVTLPSGRTLKVNREPLPKSAVPPHVSLVRVPNIGLRFKHDDPPRTLPSGGPRGATSPLDDTRRARQTRGDVVVLICIDELLSETNWRAFARHLVDTNVDDIPRLVTSKPKSKPH